MGLSTMLRSMDLTFPLSFHVGPSLLPCETSSRRMSLSLVLGLSLSSHTKRLKVLSRSASSHPSLCPRRLFLLLGALFPRAAWHLLPTLPDSAQAPPASVEPEPFLDANSR